jgi:hypothetical protein
MARKPHTCAECHSGPDVPAYKIYKVSKHGALYSSHWKTWNFDSVPWVAGKDMTAPTCAVCHISLMADEEGNVIAERTHQMNDRLALRIFGIYGHPHPIQPDTTIIRNKAGLPLPTELTGEPASAFLIDEKTRTVRRKRLKTVCLTCHGTQWVENRFARYEHAFEESNQMTLAATRILIKAWEKGVAEGLPQKKPLFDDAIEKKWVEQWLFYANSTRYASAMMGADYGVFDRGRWFMSKNLQDMLEQVMEKKN